MADPTHRAADLRAPPDDCPCVDCARRRRDAKRLQRRQLAALPDLLAACKMYVRNDKGWGDAIRAAIAKAEP